MATDARADSAVEVGVILLTLDQKAKTLRCLESFERVQAPPYRLVLLDNASSDSTLEAVEARFPEVIVHYSPENLGVASGRNAAARIAIAQLDPEFLFFLDNDMEVSPEILTELMRAIDASPEIGLATGKILMLEEPDRIYGAGGCYVDFTRGRTGHVGYGESDRGQYDRSHDCLPSGGCMLVRTTVFQELVGFDAVFDPYGPEDLDFGLRARQAGYQATYAPRATIFHQTTPGHTFEGGMSSPEYVRTKTKLWFRLMKRHARWREWLVFGLWGAPVGALRTIARETRRGNLFAMRGLVSGLLGNGDSKSPNRRS